MKKKERWGVAIIIGLIGILSSCDITNSELGIDILPAGDNVNLYHDTIFEIDAFTMTGKPVVSSEVTYSATNVMLLGALEDTIMGKSEGSVVTQFNTSYSYKPADNLEVDSLFLVLYVYDFIGETEADMNLSVYEFTERIYLDTAHKYYSDYDVEGKYNPVPLVQQTITPEDGSTYELLIEDQDFIDKFLAIQNDTTVYYSDSIFKDYFNGIYITAESVSSKGAIARIQLSNSLTRLTMRYANDSTDVDSTAERDFAFAHFLIDQYSTQKINVFEHDYSGTPLAEVIDDEHASTPYCYVQGMAGVNTRFSFASLQEWMDRTPLVINSATLVFDVVPEPESGILYDDLPDRLMTGTILEDDEYEFIYDYLVLFANDPTQQASRFGGYKKAESFSLFSDTTYTYRFNIGLHFQSMVDGEKPDNDFILQVNDGNINPRFTKLWSNLPANQRRIRLEVVYLKL
ncbi:MAG: DUF4270 family protein [Bacteroidota bacterium]|nr:DUF4270 family protein [Bacteroidota bacterium]